MLDGADRRHRRPGRTGFRFGLRRRYLQALGAGCLHRAVAGNKSVSAAVRVRGGPGEQENQKEPHENASQRTNAAKQLKRRPIQSSHLRVPIKSICPP